MFDWEFRDTWLLTLVLLAPFVYWLASGAASSLRYSSLSIADRAPRSIRARLTKLPALLLAISMVALVIALAGPRTPDAETKVSREGIAIVMVVDRSGSMLARDMYGDDEDRNKVASQNRLEAVRDVFQSFVLGDDKRAGRLDDSIGLVGFAGYADSLCPLTLDHGNLVQMVKDLEIAQGNEDGTAVGDGLALAVERLRNNSAKSKIVILLTDGVNNAGAIEPDQAAQLAAEHHIKVYCIGAGTRGTAPYPVQDPFTGRIQLRRMRVEIDEKTLESIADKTGGRYFRATDKEGLSKIYQQIDQLERTKVTEIRYLQYHEHYVSFVAVGLCLAGFASVASGSVLRRLP